MCPVVGIDSPMPSAMSGSSPIVTNSVVPIANPPVASAISASVTCGVREGEGTGGSLISRVVARVWTAAAGPPGPRNPACRRYSLERYRKHLRAGRFDRGHIP